MATTHSDYGTAAPARRADAMLRPLIAANHALHLVSSLIVLGISAYFIANFSHNTHLRYWVSISALDTLLYISALALPFIARYKGHAAPLAWVFSYLWLVAFVFAAQDYSAGASCAATPSPAGVGRCGLKRTLEAFAFLAFITNLVGTVLEGRLWDVQRGRGAPHGVEKHDAPRSAAPVTTTPGATV